VPEPGKLSRRDFAGGTVLWLPADAKAAVTVKLDAPKYRFGQTDSLREITVQLGTGALLVNEVGRH